MKRFVLALALVLLIAQPTFAQETFSFQGKLTTPEGASVADDTYVIRFQLFDQATGGSPLWEEAHTVTTEDGVFSTLLGSEMPLDIDAFENMPYLQLTADDLAMEPRVLLTAVPYAMKSYRLDEEALVAGQNVTITRRADGALQIGSTGGSGGGLTSVATDATITGNGSSGAPLGIADGSVTGAKLSNGALVAGANVGIVRRGNGSLEISAAGAGGGGLTQVMSDGTLVGNGTAGSPLAIADGAVTGQKLANDALVAGANVAIVQQGNGSWEVSSVGGGLAEVMSDATLSGDGTAGSPLAVAVPLEVAGASSSGVIRGIDALNNNVGSLGSTGSGVYGSGHKGVYGVGSGFGGAGVFGIGSSYGVWGIGTAFGVFGESNNSYGVGGSSTRSDGVHGTSLSGYGVYGGSSNSFGVYGENGSNWGALGTSNFGGAFNGDVIVLGNLAKSSGSFKIDHPLDPANKYLSHSFVESPDMMNVYNGNVITDENGEAIVTLPGYFEALNRDFRYQLTPIGAPGPNLYIAEEIAGHTFKIAGGTPGMKVSWLVTGIRQDAWAEAHRIVVEEDKPAEERGFYLHPTLFGQSPQRGIMWARNPKDMRTIQEMPARLEAEDQRMAAEQARNEAEIARMGIRQQDQ